MLLHASVGCHCAAFTVLLGSLWPSHQDVGGAWKESATLEERFAHAEVFILHILFRLFGSNLLGSLLGSN